MSAASGGRVIRIVRRIVLVAVALGVLVLAGGVVLTRALTRRAEEAYPPLGTVVQVGGLRQQVLERGQGAPVVFVHGAYGGMHDFEATILDRAAEAYRCIVWDRPGHGYSERPGGWVDPGVQAGVLLGLLEELELGEPALLVGFSYGAAVCLAAALDAPDRVRGVVMLNGPSHPWSEPLRPEYRLAGVPLVGWLVSECLVAPLGHWMSASSVERVFSPSPVPDHFERSPLALALRPESYRANTEDVRLLKPFLRAQVPRYGELEPPVLALVAEGDLAVSPTNHLPQLVHEAPRCRQIRIEDAGHQLLYTHPDLVLSTIAEAMQESARPAGEGPATREGPATGEGPVTGESAQ